MLRTFAQAAGGGDAKKVAFLTSSGFEGGMSFSIRNPSALQVLDFRNSIRDNYRCVYDVASKVLFAIRDAGSTAGVTAIDCSDSGDMLLISNFTIFIDDTAYLALDEASSVLYVTHRGADTLYAIDVSDPTNMTLLDTLTDAINLASIRGIALNPARTRAYIFSRALTAVITVDISDPSNLSVLGSYTDANIADVEEITIDQNTEVAYLAGTVVTALDCSGVTASFLSSVTLTEQPEDITLAPSQGVIYLTLRTADSVVAIDVSNPSSMSVISTLTDIDNLSGAERLEVDDVGLTLFVIDQNTDSLVSIDVIDPSAMVVLDVESTRAETMSDIALA